MINDYLKEPLEVIVYDPILGKSIKEIKLPTKKTITGGDLDIFDADIKQLKERAKTQTETYQSDPSIIGVYPTDTIYDLRYKLSVALGIPIFRQHILYKERGTKEYKPIYSLLIGNELINIDILHDLKSKSDTLLGIAIDKRLYNGKGDLNVEMFDLSILAKNIESITVIDLYTLIKPTDDFLQIDFQKEIFYYGFIYKYFPIIPYQGYLQLYDQKSHIEFIYAELNPSFSKLKAQYSLEKKLLDQVIKDTSHIIHDYKKLTSREMYYLTMAVVSFDIPTLNPRMFVDRFVLDDYYIFISTSIHIGSKVFNVNKKFNTYTGEIYTDLHKLHINSIYIQTVNGIKIMIDENKVNIEMRYTESSKITYEDAKKLIKRIYSYINNMIVTMGKIITKDGVTTELGTPIISSSNVRLIWPQSVLSSAFIEMKEYLYRYEDANIIKITSTEAGSYHLLLKYGVTSPMKNIGYDYYTSKEVKDLVNSKRYKAFQFIQESSQFSIVINNISQEEFEMNQYIILDIVYGYIIGFSEKKTATKFVDDPSTKRLKRLKTMDPDLYDTKKYDPKADVYSIKCQLGRQPMIYRESEYKELPNKVKDGSVKFWNMTENRPAYYHCPDKKFPYLSFMPRSHPLGYCLPCCKKKVSREQSVQAKIDKECLVSYSINAEKLKALMSNKYIDKHTLSYGKKIPNGRESYAPSFLDKQYRLAGIQESTDTGAPFPLINCIIFLLDMSLENFIKDILEVINESTFHLLNIGSLRNVLNHKSLKDTLYSLIIDKKMDIIDISYIDWDNLIAELVYMAYSLNILILNELELKMIRTTELAIITEEKLNDYLVIVRHDEGTYPLTHINSDKKSYSFETDSTIIKFFRKVLLFNTNDNNDDESFNFINIIKFTTNSKNLYEIDVLLRGMRGFIYAVILKNTKTSGKVFVPITYTEFLSDEYPVEETFNEKYYKLLRKDLYIFLEMYSKNLIYSYHLVYKNKFVGLNIKFRHDHYGFIFPYKAEDEIGKHKDIKTINIPYDIVSVNKALVLNDTKREQGLKTEAEKYLYENNIYNLFLIEFAREIRKHKNTSVRKELEPVLKTTSLSINKKKVRDILHDFPNDIMPIMNIIDMYSKKQVSEVIENIMFEFDMEFLSKIKNKDMKGREEIIDKLMKPGVDIVKTLPNKISNNFISCDYDIEQPQCNSTKLMMLETDYRKCIKNIIHDIDNTYIYETLMVNIIGNINPFSFIQRPFELLTIREV